MEITAEGEKVEIKAGGILRVSMGRRRMIFRNYQRLKKARW